MKTRHWLRATLGFLALCCAATSHGQTTGAAGSVIVFPNVASTASFNSEVNIQNRNDVAVTLDVLFYESLNSTTKGLHTCTQFVVPAGESLSFTLAAQCSLDTATHFGMLIVRNHDLANQTEVFYGYTRTQTPQGVGFSVEGFPIGNFSGAVSYVQGLKRSSTGPTYQSNCFIGALGERIDFKVTLFAGADGTESAPLGSFSGALLPFVSYRFLDVFTALGAPTGDYTNVRARYEITALENGTNGVPAYIGFCTVQESNTFSADFRIAKSQDAQDFRQKRQICYSQTGNPCGTLTANPTTVIATEMNVHELYIAQPDFIQCDLVGPNTDELQIRLHEPGNYATAPVFVPAAPYDGAPFTAGGAGHTGFYIYTGERSEWNGGSTDRWYIDVEASDANTGAGAVPYGMTCTAGNGISIPYVYTVVPRVPDASF